MPSSRRILSLWLPCLATDRLRRRLPAAEAGRPLVAVAAERGRLTVAAACRQAQAAGISPGQPLADARALEPGVLTRDADPAADATLLERLADWARRWTPWTAVDTGPQVLSGAGGLWLDITGCAHLFGGEAGLIEDLVERLRRAGLEARAAVAGTTGAAWAMARFGGPLPWPLIVPPGTEAEHLAPLPLPALRLPPPMITALRRVGLRSIAALLDKPRAALVPRYGPLPGLRLDQALGRVEEPLSPGRPQPAHQARQAFAEPVSTPEDLRRVLVHLLGQVCRGLAAAGQGARRLELLAWRSDAGPEAPPQTLAVGTSRPNRDPAHLLRLFQPSLDRLEPGPGFEVMALAVPAAEPSAQEQTVLAVPPPQARIPPPAGRSDLDLVAGGRDAEQPADAEADNTLRHRPAFSVIQGGTPPRPAPAKAREPRSPRCYQGPPVPELVDQLGARLGLARILRPRPRESWWPERAVALCPADAPASGPEPPLWPADRPRPVRLLPRPEPVEVVAPVPDDPPLQFRWRDRLYRVRHAEGPERIAAEWWQAPDQPEEPLRDYYRVETGDGQRFWLYRLGLFRPDEPARWFLHGFLG
ncbi:DUF6504 family protein [Rhodocista pekingensis]|uniref:DNA-directed DNA polymerase n=1 Tax=Rhodocista pekingensis TaxID=201185 RepID=A0ABW2KSU8_9PROT